MFETPKLLLKLHDKRYLILYMVFLATLLWLTLQAPGIAAPGEGATSPNPVPG